MASNNRGRDLIGVQNLIKKHQAMQGEIANHEPRIDAVSQTAQKMVEDGHFNSVSNFIPLQSEVYQRRLFGP